MTTHRRGHLNHCPPDGVPAPDPSALSSHPLVELARSRIRREPTGAVPDIVLGASTARFRLGRFIDTVVVGDATVHDVQPLADDLEELVRALRVVEGTTEHRAVIPGFWSGAARGGEGDL